MIATDDPPTHDNGNRPWVAGSRTLTGTFAAGIDISQSKGWPLM